METLTNTTYRSKSQQKILVESRKHPIAYVGPGLLLFFFGIPLLINILISFGSLFQLSSILFLLFALPLTFWAISQVILNIKYRWTLTEEMLIAESGFLPWDRQYYEIPIDNIYEALCRQQFLGTFFGFGDITIRRTDGSTSWFKAHTITRHKEMTTAINALVRAHKQATAPRYAEPVASKTSSLAEELSQMLALKNQGVLSAEEFQQIKSNLINSQR